MIRCWHCGDDIEPGRQGCETCGHDAQQMSGVSGVGLHYAQQVDSMEVTPQMIEDDATPIDLDLAGDTSGYSADAVLDERFPCEPREGSQPRQIKSAA